MNFKAVSFYLGSLSNLLRVKRNSLGWSAPNVSGLHSSFIISRAMQRQGRDEMGSNSVEGLFFFLSFFFSFFFFFFFFLVVVVVFFLDSFHLVKLLLLPRRSYLHLN